MSEKIVNYLSGRTELGLAVVKAYVLNERSIVRDKERRKNLYKWVTEVKYRTFIS